MHEFLIYVDDVAVLSTNNGDIVCVFYWNRGGNRFGHQQGKNKINVVVKETNEKREK